MDDALRELTRPTAQQAACRGGYLGALVAGAGLVGLIGAWLAGVVPPDWLWSIVLAGPLMLGAPLGMLAGRRVGARVSDGGIRLPDRVARWDEVVDLRAERRGNRTVVAVYLESGASAQLPAPYSGGLLTADPRFEGKMVALSCMWQSRRFGGLLG